MNKLCPCGKRANHRWRFSLQIIRTGLRDAAGFRMIYFCTKACREACFRDALVLLGIDTEEETRQ